MRGCPLPLPPSPGSSEKDGLHRVFVGRAFESAWSILKMPYFHGTTGGRASSIKPTDEERAENLRYAREHGMGPGSMEWDWNAEGPGLGNYGLRPGGVEGYGSGIFQGDMDDDELERFFRRLEREGHDFSRENYDERARDVGWTWAAHHPSMAFNYARSTDGREDSVVYAIPIGGPNAPDWVDVFTEDGSPEHASRTADFIPEEHLEEVFRYPKRAEGQSMEEWDEGIDRAFLRWLKQYDNMAYWPPW